MIKFFKSFYSSIIFYLRYYNTIQKNGKLTSSNKSEVYILGSGPSMKGISLNSLKRKNCIFLNNFIAHPEFKFISNCNSAEKIYLIAPIHPPQDEETWLKWLNEIDDQVAGTPIKLTLGLNARKINIKHIVEKNNLFKNNEVYYYYAGNYFESLKKSNISFSGNIIASETAALYGIYLAISMGYKKIILLGFDHNYILFQNVSEMRMYDKAVHQANEGKHVFSGDKMYNEYLRQYKIFKKYSKLNELFPNLIVNQTKGGLLNIFKREKFHE